MTTDQLLPEAEAARMLGISVLTVRRWRQLGRGPAWHKIGAAVRYHPADLERYIRSARRTATTDRGAP